MAFRMIEESLESIGLTKSEVKVYLSLLDLGSSSVGKIIEKSKVTSSKIYELLDKLTEKGLVSSVIKKGIKYFEAAPPNRILDYLNEKEIKLKSQIVDIKKILPELEFKQKLSKEVSEISVYKSMKGIETIFSIILNSLSKNDEYSVFGARTGATEAQRIFLLKYHEKRIEKEIKLKILFSKDVKNITQPYKKMKFTKVKYMNSQLMSPTQTMIVKNKTIIILWKENPMGIVIENKEIASSYEKYFWFLWRVEWFITNKYYRDDQNRKKLFYLLNEHI